MVFLKKIVSVAASAALATTLAAALTGCGEDVAATWAHGKILEEDITTAATNTMASYVTDDGSTDVDAWTQFIEGREYESDDEDEESADSTTEESEEGETSEEATEEKGTVAEYREYLIKQQLRSEIVKYQIEQQNIEVTDEEIDEEVDAEAAMYEAYYGGGMSGTFESIINNYFGMTMDEFRESVSEYLAEQKLQEATVGSAEDAEGDEASEEGTDDAQEADDADEGDTSGDVDYDALFEEYLDGQVESANLSIKDCPSDLSYDPAVVAKNAESSESESSGESTDESADSDESADDATDASDESADAKEEE